MFAKIYHMQQPGQCLTLPCVKIVRGEMALQEIGMFTDFLIKGYLFFFLFG